MNSPLFESPCERPPTLAVRATAAAQMLGISERLLASKTKHGDIPHVRVGRAVVYPVDGLREWLASNSHAGRDSAHDTTQQNS